LLTSLLISFYTLFFLLSDLSCFMSCKPLGSLLFVTLFTHRRLYFSISFICSFHCNCIFFRVCSFYSLSLSYSLYFLIPYFPFWDLDIIFFISLHVYFLPFILYKLHFTRSLLSILLIIHFNFLLLLSGSFYGIFLSFLLWVSCRLNTLSFSFWISLILNYYYTLSVFLSFSSVTHLLLSYFIWLFFYVLFLYLFIIVIFCLQIFIISYFLCYFLFSTM
jgi:hypothetical protein